MPHPLRALIFDVNGALSDTGRHGHLPACNEATMIKDSEEGLEDALAAGIPTAVFCNDYTFGKPFSGAHLVAPGLEHFINSQRSLE